MESTESERMAAAILRQGELRLNAQVQLAIAADQRGSILAGTYAAAATAFLGWSGWLLQSDSGDGALAAGLLGAAVVFLVGAGLCVYAVRPVELYTAGCRPKAWTSDGALDRRLSDAYLREAENYDQYIIDNRRVMEGNTQALGWAIKLSALGPVVAAAVYVVVALFV